VAFVQNRETIDLIKEARRGGEWSLLKEHLTDRRLRILAMMGLTLRRLEKDPKDKDRLLDLRQKILRKYGGVGLHAAELVQRGTLETFLLLILREAESPAEVGPAVEDLLNRVDQYTAFVQQADEVDDLVKELQVRVLSRVSQVFIIFAYGAQKKRARKVLEGLMEVLPKGYGAETHETGRSFTAFVGKMVEGEVQINLPFE